MICDLHVHVAGTSAAHPENYLAPAFVRSLAFRAFLRRFGVSGKRQDWAGLDDLIGKQTLRWLGQSAVDRAVLLALDAPYRADGTQEKALLVTSNDFVAGLASTCPKALFGASVHPYRTDALRELERVVRQGACLVKWLPGAQNIQADDPRCFPFYEALAHYRVPLLCHTGSEHTLRAFPNSLNDPKRLLPALERGVTVIAAHCGTSVFLHEKSYFKTWREMALEHEHFYGDLSAFGIMTRVRPLRMLLKSPALLSKAVYGSDFPAWNMPLSCVGLYGFREAVALRRINNPFDQAVQVMKAAGVPDEVFSLGATLIRLPENHPKPTVNPRVLAL